MRYSTEPKYTKRVKGYAFLSFSRKLDDKYGKKLMDTATKTGMDASKTASIEVVQKTAEASGDLIGKKTVDKITSLGKKRVKKNKKDKKCTYHHKKYKIILMTSHKNGIPKNYKLIRYNTRWNV